MSIEPKPRPFDHLWQTAREYLTHWVIAGVIVTLAGIAPHHWFAHLFQVANLHALREALATVDYRLTAGLGVLVSAVALQSLMTTARIGEF